MTYKMSWHPTFWMKPWENPMSYGPRAFVPNVNPIWIKEKTHDFFMAHLFFFDPHNFMYFVHKI